VGCLSCAPDLLAPVSVCGNLCRDLPSASTLPCLSLWASRRCTASRPARGTNSWNRLQPRYSLPISYMLVMFRLHPAQSLPLGPLTQCEPSAFREVLTWYAVRPGRLCWPQCLDTCDPRTYARTSPLSCSCHFWASSRARRLAQAQSVFHLPSSIACCSFFIVAKDGLHRAHQSLAQRPRVALVCGAILPP
jgi:hypothetical protein